ncbi:MAG TPA: hypothetical protein VNN21_06165 [Dehalococcoidia bacterium]|nr:hypothetical protein [Dehalococcoidia bacterium]
MTAAEAGPRNTFTFTLTQLHESWSTQVVAKAWSDVLTSASDAAMPQAVAPPPAEVVEYRPVSAALRGWATHYGESFAGQPLGCGYGPYYPWDASIVAVGPSRYREWPCGTLLQVCGPAGCIVAVRQDSCPGCASNVVDLSEAGNELVCGSPPHTCRVTIQRLRPVVVLQAEGGS